MRYVLVLFLLLGCFHDSVTGPGNQISVVGPDSVRFLINCPFWTVWRFNVDGTDSPMWLVPDWPVIYTAAGPGSHVIRSTRSVPTFGERVDTLVPAQPIALACGSPPPLPPAP